MTTIRPQPPLPALPAKPVNDARAAFFQAVRGPAAAAPIQAPAPRPQPMAAASNAKPAAQGEPAAPQRFLRPGSLVDIKV